jgi:intracellular sulfur oxidation DsrE/DsrF family protein
MTRRREFLAQLGVTAAALAFDPDEMRAASSPASGPWDTSWLDRLATAQYRVVFNASDIADGAAMDFAATFLDHMHEAHDTTDKQTRPVIVFRRLGTVMAFNDAIWDRYKLGEDRKVTDSATQAPARRNVFWKTAPGASDQDASSKIETLQGRGLICLVCNIAVNNVGASLAAKTKREVEEVRKDLKANLVPGAILVPSGIYALIRAQNAGCAFMSGTGS